MNGSLSPWRLALGVSGSLFSLGLALAQSQAPAGNQQQTPAGTQQAPNSPGAVGAAQGQPGQEQPAQGQPGQASDPTAMHGGPRIGDREMAEALLVDNQGEVAMAQFVLQKTQNEEVRQFAQKLIEDHQKMIDSLRQAGAGGGATTAGQGDAAGQPSTAGSTPSATTGQGRPDPGATAAADRRNSVNPGAAELQAGRGTSGGTDFVSLKRELGRQCLQSAQRELGAKQGAEFEKCYIGMQIAAHQHAVDTLTVFRRHASDQLGRTIDEGLPVVQAHLEHAKQLIKRLDSAAPSSGGANDQSKQ